MRVGARVIVLLLAVLAGTLAARWYRGGREATRAGSQASAQGPLACPMRCEPGKSYTDRATCPVCRMQLEPLESLPFGLIVQSDPKEVVSGAPTRLILRPLDQTGLPAGPLRIVHEHPIHVMIVSSDLSWFRHEHPVPMATSTSAGKESTTEYELDLTFPFPGEFTLFADFEPEGAASHEAAGESAPVHVHADGARAARAVVRVAGAPPPVIPLGDTTESVHRVDGYEVRLRCNGEKFFAAGPDHSPSLLRFGISREGDLEPITDLDPYLGAMGHLAIISADRTTYIHAHPIEPTTSDSSSTTKSAPHDAALARAAAAFGNGTLNDLVFAAEFPRPGMYRTWAQFSHSGKVITVPITIDVQPRPGTDGSVPASPGGHEHHHADHSPRSG